MTPSRKGRISVRDGVMFREIAGESVLLDLNSETYFGLDEIGTRMWNVLVGAPSIEAACEVLIEEFEVDAGAMRVDLSAFITTLADAGLVAVDDE